MAFALGINQSSYGKLEKEGSRISIDRLKKIADFLEEDLADVLGMASKNAFTQTNQGNGYVETINQDNKELIKELKEVHEKLLDSKDQLLRAKDEQIALLKTLIEQKF